jgi:hypothetical protein
MNEETQGRRSNATPSHLRHYCHCTTSPKSLTREKLLDRQANVTIKNLQQHLPLAQAAMFYQPSYKTMIVRLLGSSLFGSLYLILFLKTYQVKSFIYGKTLIQEGVDEQIQVLLLHV